jgi:tetratricopeptide (TPR) repeat protein
MCSILNSGWKPEILRNEESLNMRVYIPIRWLVGCWLAGACLVGPLAARSARGQDGAADAKAAAAATPPAAEALQQQAAELIRQLGDDDFATREAAEAKLVQMGLDVFDVLHAAQNNNDPEIALRARHLVRSMSVRWFADDDPPEVVKILRGYGDQTDDERRSRMDRLAALPEQEGVVALCRLARFETVDVLSKYAALLVLQSSSEDEPAPEGLAEKIAKVMASSNRPAADWLRLYSKTLTDPSSTLAEWDAATKAEQLTRSRHPDKSSPEIVRDLYRWQVDLLQRLGKNDEADVVIRRTISLVDGTPEQLQELVSWLLHAERYQVVLEVAERFVDEFGRRPELLYRLAEAQLKLDRKDEAEATAERALAIDPEDTDLHRIVALKLQEAGLHAWAEREFRHILKSAAAGSLVDFQIRFLLSEMLHDQAQDQAAGEVLQPLCDLMDKDEAAKATAARMQRDPDSVYSRMHYFYACVLIEQEKFDEAEERLAKALDADATDADVLIAMYRLPNRSAERQAKTRTLIEESAGAYRKQLKSYEELAAQAQNEQTRAAIQWEIALQCNQIAWLVSNTEGDYDEALRLSHKSLEIRVDNAGYLDTLGRCYYAKGDYAGAVRYQSRAVKLDPHSGQIKRQLAFFEKELAAHGPGKPARGEEPAGKNADPNRS